MSKLKKFEYKYPSDACCAVYLSGGLCNSHKELQEYLIRLLLSAESYVNPSGATQ